MGLVIAYFLVWMFIALYVTRLGIRQRRLEGAVAALEEETKGGAGQALPTAKAA
ncbi:MAG: CcmD family protein [Pirellulales bacterium]|nr:CcmD family protein [Pirellulales bacterium]